MKKYDLFDISSEIKGISALITGLSNQLEDDCMSLSKSSLRDSLYGVASYLDRIVDGLEEIDESTRKAGVANETN